MWLEKSQLLPRQQVRDVLANLGRVYEYSTNVQLSQYISPHTIGIGAARKCDLGDSAWVNKKVIERTNGAGFDFMRTQ